MYTLIDDLKVNNIKVRSQIAKMDQRVALHCNTSLTVSHCESAKAVL